MVQCRPTTLALQPRAARSDTTLVNGYQTTSTTLLALRVAVTRRSCSVRGHGGASLASLRSAELSACVVPSTTRCVRAANTALPSKTFVLHLLQATVFPSSLEQCGCQTRTLAVQDAVDRHPTALDSDNGDENEDGDDEDADEDDDDDGDAATTGDELSTHRTASTASRPTPGSSHKDSDYSAEDGDDKEGDTDCEMVDSESEEEAGPDEGQALRGCELEKIMATKQDNGRLSYLCKFKGSCPFCAFVGRKHAQTYVSPNVATLLRTLPRT